jgi:DNA-binding CsgD family transcriptional regulator
MCQVAAAGGNPLYIVELVDVLLQDKAITIVADIADRTTTVATELPDDSLTAAVSWRLESLSRPARQVLPMAAALGSIVNVGELAAVLNGSILDVWSAVIEAVDCGLLTRADSELVFRHDLIRKVLAEQLPASLRADLLRRAGQVLQATDAPIERIAYYLAAGDHELDTDSLDWLVAVADKLIVRAPEIAVQLLRRAVTVADLGSSTRSSLIGLQAQALLWSGFASEAESVVRAALRTRWENGDDIGLRWRLAQACHAQGRLADAVDIAESALSDAGIGAEDAGSFHGLSGLDNFFLGRLGAAAAAAEQALDLGAATNNPLATGYGLMALGAVRYTEGHLSEALDLSGRIIAVFDNGIGSDQFDPYVLHAHCLIELDRFGDAEETLNTAIGHNRRMNGAYLAPNLIAKARLHLLDGRWDDAVAACSYGVEVPDVFGYAPVARSFAALIGIHRGTFLPDPNTVPAPDGQLGSSGYAQFHPWINALVHETHGRQDLALKLLVDAELELSDGLSAPTLYYIFPDIARLAADLGDQNAALSVSASADAVAAREPTPARRGTALLCRGLVERDPAVLAAAASAFRESGRPLYEACAFENAAVVLAGAGRDGEARTALDTAVALYTRLGASWDSSRAVARVRPYGIRRGVRGPRNRPKSGWAALTDTERKVAILVAEGFSNSDIAAQMFLSSRTIQSHVSNTLAKLGLRSRREVARAMPGR